MVVVSSLISAAAALLAGMPSADPKSPKASSGANSSPPHQKPINKTLACASPAPVCASPQAARTFLESVFLNGQIPHFSPQQLPALCQDLLDLACGRRERVHPKSAYPTKIYRLKGHAPNISAMTLGALGTGIVGGSAAVGQGLAALAKGYFYYHAAGLALEVAADGQFDASEALQVFALRYFGDNAARTLAKHPGLLGALLAGLQLAAGGFVGERGARFIHKIEAEKQADFSVFTLSARQAGLKLADAAFAAFLLRRPFAPRSPLGEAAPRRALEATLTPIPSSALVRPVGAPLAAPGTSLAAFGAAAGPGAGLALYNQNSLAAPTVQTVPAAPVSEEQSPETAYLSGSLSYSPQASGGSAAPHKLQLRAAVTRFDFSLGQGPWGGAWTVQAVSEQGELQLSPSRPHPQSPTRVAFKPDPAQTLTFKRGDELKIYPGVMGAAGQDPSVLELENLFAEYQSAGILGAWKKPWLISKILKCCLQEMGFDPEQIERFLALNMRGLSHAKKLFDLFLHQVKEGKGVGALVQELRGLRQQLDTMGRERLAQYDDFRIYPAHRPKEVVKNYRILLLRMALGESGMRTTYLLSQELPRKHAKLKAEPRSVAPLAYVTKLVTEGLSGFDLDTEQLSPRTLQYINTVVVFLTRDSDLTPIDRSEFEPALSDYLMLNMEEFVAKVVTYAEAELGSGAKDDAAVRRDSWQTTVVAMPLLRKYQADFDRFARVLQPAKTLELVEGFRNLYGAMPQVVTELNPEILFYVDSVQRKAFLNSIKLKVHPDQLAAADKADAKKEAQARQAFLGITQIANALEGAPPSLSGRAGERRARLKAAAN